MIFRAFLLIAVAASFTGCETIDEMLLAPDSGPVVYVREPSRPVYFDPYYNRPKYYQPNSYYESTSKKTKGNKVYKTTTVKNQYGQTVYKNTTTSKKKKKKN